MAKLSFIINKQRPNSVGRYPIQLRIVAGNSNTAVSCNVSVSENAFIGIPEKVVSRTFANAKQVNADLKDLYYTYINAINELDRLGYLQTMSAVDIKRYVEKRKEFHAERTFSSCFEEYKQSCRTEKTKQTFDYTEQVLRRFTGKDKIFFEDINYKFLTDIEHWMEQNNIGMSSRGIVFRNIRTVYNNAINNDWINPSMYPFRKFKIKQKPKEIVYLREEKMQQLLALDLSGEQKKALLLARDLFLLSFYLCGINPIDLYKLPREDTQIKFIRTKTSFHEPAPIRISLQPEAKEIIERHKGETHLINLAERYASFDSCYHSMKHRLKTLGEMIGCHDITFYWARYSWATYASKIDVSDSVISKALGHSVSTLAEKKYISFDWTKVDKANRKVIDYIINKEYEDA